MAKLEINRGTTYTKTGTYSKNGVLQDLTNATIRFTMKRTEADSDWDDSDALLQKDVTSFAAPLTGAYEILLNPADTAQIAVGKYFYDVKVDVNSDGAEVYKLDEGTIKLDGSPTNRLS